MSSLAARRRRTLDFWPGFVDALSSLLMVLVFLLMVFTIGQFVLSDAISGRDKALAQLNAELAQLAKTLSMEQQAKTAALARVEELGASLLRTSNERDALQTQLADVTTKLDEAQTQAAQLSADIAALRELKQQLEAEIASKLADLEQTRDKLTVQTELSAKSAAQVELLNRQMAALRQQLAEISQALELAKQENLQKDVRIEELGRDLNVALANKVNQLARYRSEFFGKLREILGNREDIRIVGDRFVVPSELLFESGSDELDEDAMQQLDRLAQVLKEVTAEIPSDLDWVLRIDGHTDLVPIHTERFPSNWELSTARAIAIVKYLVATGIPANRLAAAGFGQFQPIDRGSSPEALAKNRRIEIQLTNR